MTELANQADNALEPTNGVHWKHLVFFAYTNFWVGVCVSINIPLFATEATEKGASPALQFMVVGSFEFAIAATCVFFAGLKECVSPSRLIKGGLLLCGLSAAAFGFVNKVSTVYPFLGLALLLRTLQGLGASAFLASQLVIVGAQFPEGVLRIKALTESFFGFGMIVGLPIGGLLYELTDFTGTFMALGTSLLLGNVCSLVILTHSPEPININDKYAQTGNILQLDLVLDYCLATCGIAAIGFNVTTLGSRLKELSSEPSDMTVHAVFVGLGLVYVVSCLLWDKLLCGCVAAKGVAILGCFSVAVSYVLIGPPSFIEIDTTVWMLILGLLLFAAGTACQMTSAFASFKHSTPARGPCDRTYVRLSICFTVACAVGALLGPLLGGLALEYIGYKCGTFIFLVLEVTMALLLCVDLAQKITGRYRTQNDQRMVILPSFPATSNGNRHWTTCLQQLRRPS